MLMPFLSAIRTVRLRVWILDKHFEGPEYEILREPLVTVFKLAKRERRQKPVVRILTARYDDLRTTLADGHRAIDGVEIRSCNAGYHDRYALLDSDLWHFGSTVGGAQQKLSCASHGWTSHAEAFSQLFDDWWGK